MCKIDKINIRGRRGILTVYLHAQLFDILLLIIGYRKSKDLNC